MRQFNRRYRLIVDTRDVTEMDFSFSVKKNLKGTPNTCEIKVLNVNGDTRNAWTKKKKPACQLQVGYEDSIATIFLGFARTVEFYQEGTETHCEIKGGDGEPQLRSAWISRGFPEGTKAEEYLDAAARAIGVDEGNLADAKSKLSSKGLGSIFTQSVFFGSAASMLDRVCKSYGFEWSVQEGALQILEIDQPIDPGKVFLVSPDTGLRGSPRIDNKNIVSFECNLNPLIRPGSLVQLSSDLVSGGFRISDVEHSGDTAGDDWKTVAHGKKY